MEGRDSGIRGGPVTGVARRLLALSAAAALLATATASAGEPGTVRKASELRQAPFRDAASAGALASGAKVDITQKRGGWYQVKSGKLEGWIRMLSVRRAQAPKRGADAAGVVALASGRAGTGRVVSTTGIRGLSEEELQLARFDEVQLQALDGYAVSRDDAQRFAREGKLASRTLD